MVCSHTADDAALLAEINDIVWGTTHDVPADILERWLNHGFVFSPSEPSALVQKSGGPCGVLAPVQAHMIRHLLFAADEDHVNWRNRADYTFPLVASFSAIIERARVSDRTPLVVCLLKAKTQPLSTHAHTPSSHASTTNPPAHPAPEAMDASAPNPAAAEAGAEGGSATATTATTTTATTTTTAGPHATDPASLSAPMEAAAAAVADTVVPSLQDFFARLEISRFESGVEVTGSLFSIMDDLQGPFGVLLFLYSVLLTRGAEAVRADQGVQIEPLISRPFGHATQSLVNLLLVGAATANVWDGTRDADGLLLPGIDKRAEVGLLSLLETLRLCSVGSNLKTPVYPVWLLASESHYTVLFSPDGRITRESTMARALRLFAAHDKEGGGYLSHADAMTVLRTIRPNDSNARLSTLLQDMDREQMGIVLRTSFEKVLFPKGDEEDVTQFEVYHYNGIAPPGAQLSYSHGRIRLGDFLADDTQIAQCLRTKWVEMQLQWDGPVPKLS